jgi:hypothetical protein
MDAEPTVVEAQSPKEPPSEIKNFLLSLLLALLCGATGFAISHFWWEPYSDRIRYLDYCLTGTSDLSILPGIGRSARGTIDGRPLAKLSTVQIQVFNLTDRDYEKVPVKVQFEDPPIGGRPGILDEVVKSAPGAATGTIPGILPAIVVKRPVTTPPAFVYELPVVNRSSEPVLEIAYLFDAEKPPKITVSVSHSKLEARQIDTAQKHDAGAIPSWVVDWLIVLTAIGFVQYIDWRRDRARNRR